MAKPFFYMFPQPASRSAIMLISSELVQFVLYIFYRSRTPIIACFSKNKNLTCRFKVSIQLL